MSWNLFPDRYVKSALAVTPEELKQKGIEGLILDIDNTLEPYFVPDPREEVKSWIRNMEKSGILLYIVSNGKEERVKRFDKELGLPYICRAQKPSSKGFEAAKASFGLPENKIAVIGDQIFTDVWGGNKAGMYTILAKKVSPRDEWITAIKRPLEVPILLAYRLIRRKRS